MSLMPVRSQTVLQGLVRFSMCLPSIFPGDIPLAHRQGQQCVITQLPMVVEILIAKRDPIEPLRYQFLHAVFNARRIAVIHKARRHPRRHPGALVHLPQKDTPGVRTDATAVKSAGYLATPKGVKFELLSGTVSSRLLPLWLA